MLSLALAIFLPFVLTYAATPTNQTANCDFTNGILDVYQHPNASSSYSIPAIVSSGSSIMNSTDQTWQIVDSIGNVSASFNVNPQAEQLSHIIYLDTSSTINASALTSPLPFAGCAFTFELPSSYAGKRSSDGSCGEIFGQSCLNEIMQIAQDTTAAIPSTAGSSNPIDTCDTVTTTLYNYLTTSPKACSKDGPAIAVTQGKCLLAFLQSHITSLTGDPALNFSRASTENCTNPPTTLPYQLFSTGEPFEPGNYTTYDQFIKTTTPILLAIFSNGTSVGGSSGGFAQTHMTCTSPMNVTAGSHDPTSAAVLSAVVDVKSVVGFALAINALVFFML